MAYLSGSAWSRKATAADEFHEALSAFAAAVHKAKAAGLSVRLVVEKGAAAHVVDNPDWLVGEVVAVISPGEKPEVA